MKHKGFLYYFYLFKNIALNTDRPMPKSGDSTLDEVIVVSYPAMQYRREPNFNTRILA